MTFSCDINSLKKTLENMEKILPPVPSMPILGGIQINANSSSNSISLYATNLDTEMEIEIPAVVNEDCSFIIDKTILNISNALESGSLDVEYDEKNEKVIMSTGNNVFESSIIKDENFPKDGFMKEGKKITVNKEEFTECLKNSYFAASSDESRGIINGENIEIKDGIMSFVAIDGVRMAIIKNPVKTEENIEFTIHRKELKAFVDILEKTDVDAEDITFYIQENNFHIYMSNIKFRTKLLEGNYINYKDILPKESNITIEIDKKSLEQALTKVSSILLNKNEAVLFDTKNNILNLLVQTEECRAEEKNIEIEKAGEDIKFKLNIRLLEEIVRHIVGEKIKMVLVSNEQPILIKTENEEKYTFMILPIRL